MNQIRYIEISRRNPVTKIKVGSGSYCSPTLNCEDVCIEIRRAGKKNCDIDYCPDNPCCSPKPKSVCPTFVAKVCSMDIDEEGFAIFEWPTELYDIKEGWYEGHVYTGCYSCSVLPLRVGPRCNVLEVEMVTVGPDNACIVGCEDDCKDGICHPTKTSSSDGKAVYIPKYEV